MAQWFWRKRYFISKNVFSLFRNYLPLEKDRALRLNKLESPLTKGCFVPSLVEIDPVVLEKKFFKFHKCFSVILIWNYLPLEKGRSLYLNKLESPSPRDALCQVWLKLALWFWRRRWKCEKMTTMTTTDNFWSEKLTCAFSSGELKKVVNQYRELGSNANFNSLFGYDKSINIQSLNMPCKTMSCDVLNLH